MSDFMDGDQFPGRPDHPDFWRMSECVLKQDGKLSETDATFQEAVSEIVDIDSLAYMAEQRSEFLMEHLGVSSTPAMKGVLMTVYLDAFVTGVGFQQAGGKR